MPINKPRPEVLPKTACVPLKVPVTSSFADGELVPIPRLPFTVRFDDSAVLPVTPNVVPTVAAPVTPRDASVAAPEFNVPLIVAF